MQKNIITASDTIKVSGAVFSARKEGKYMKKSKIAVIFGGCSTEYEVSLQSAYSVLKNLGAEKYEVIPVGITREGKWFHYTGEYERIADNSWWEDIEYLFPAVFPANKGAGGFIEFHDEKYGMSAVILLSRCFMEKTARTVRCRGFFSFREFPLSAAVCFPLRCAWTKRGRTGLFPPLG